MNDLLPREKETVSFTILLSMGTLQKFKMLWPLKRTKISQGAHLRRVGAGEIVRVK
jgi:hypothetical protein